jgi:hypothetical protein
MTARIVARMTAQRRQRGRAAMNIRPPPFSAVMKPRFCIAWISGFGLACCALACEAVGTVGQTLQSDESSDESSSTAAVDAAQDASSDTSSDASSSDSGDSKPATTDEDPGSGGSLTTGGDASSSSGDGEGDSTDEGPMQFDTDSSGGTDDGVDGCCAADDQPGCADPMIESCVCELDAYCCEQAWDEACVNTAQLSGCSPCGGEPPPQLDCCTDNESQGCTDVDVQDCVCLADPYCCEQAWDQACVDQVDQLGCGACNVR